MRIRRPRTLARALIGSLREVMACPCRWLPVPRHPDAVVSSEIRPTGPLVTHAMKETVRRPLSLPFALPFPALSPCLSLPSLPFLLSLSLATARASFPLMATP